MEEKNINKAETSIVKGVAELPCPTRRKFRIDQKSSEDSSELIKYQAKSL